MVVVQIAVERLDPATVHQIEVIRGGAQQVTVVGDHHHGTLEALQRHGQGVAHLQIQVVGRFIQQQEVRLLPGDEGQHQPRLLAAGEGGHLVQRLVTVEAEAAEVVAQLLLGLVRREAGQVIERGIVQAQGLELMLGEVADADPGAHLQLARQRRIGARQHLDEGGLAGAVAPEQADARARHQVHLYLLQDHLVTVTGAQVLHGDEGGRQGRGLAKLEAELGVGVGGQYLLHPLHGFQPALGLTGLGGLVAEAVHIGLHVGHLPLLLLVHGLLLGQLLGALQLEVGVAAGVFVELAVLDVDDAVDDRIEEVAVVRNQHQRALIALEPLLQPDDGIQIQVVGRFIEQQQIGAAEQGLGQVQAHAPATGEATHRRVELIAPKAQAVQQLGGAGADAVGAYGV